MCILKQGLCLIENITYGNKLAYYYFLHLWVQPSFLIIKYTVWNIPHDYDYLLFPLPSSHPSNSHIFVKQWLLFWVHSLMTWNKIIFSTKKYATETNNNEYGVSMQIPLQCQVQPSPNPAATAFCWQSLDTGNCNTYIQTLSHKKAFSESHDMKV